MSPPSKCWTRPPSLSKASTSLVGKPVLEKSSAFHLRQMSPSTECVPVLGDVKMEPFSNSVPDPGSPALLGTFHVSIVGYPTAERSQPCSAHRYRAGSRITWGTAPLSPLFQ